MRTLSNMKYCSGDYTIDEVPEIKQSSGRKKWFFHSLIPIKEIWCLGSYSVYICKFWPGHWGVNGVSSN